jgi:transposase-like protein
VIGKVRLSRNWSERVKRAWKAQIEKILAMYARGMTTRGIQAQLQERDARGGVTHADF